MEVVLEEPESVAVQSKPLPRYLLRRISPRSQPFEWTSTPQASTQNRYISEAAAADSDLPRPVPRRRVPDPAVVHQVQTIVGRIISSLQKQDDDISVSLKSKRPSIGSSSQSSTRPSNDFYKLSFPGSTPEEAWRFTVVLRILELVHEALVTKMLISKRNIYYKDPELFKSQTVVDRYIDIIAYTLGIQRAALNVVSLPFFDVYKHCSLVPWLLCSCGKDPILLDNVDNIRSVDISSAQWVIVVEKEAKGYPDISTRAFLRLLSISSHPPPPIYALVDFDPDGIAIMSTYKHGSLTLSYENANLKTPIIRWLGLRSRDLDLAELPSSSQGDERKGILVLSARDRKKAVKMLEQETYHEGGPEQEWRREIQTMLVLNIKAEMEMLGECIGGVQKWVEQRLCEDKLRVADLGSSIPATDVFTHFLQPEAATPA
ncbi:MAG: hypothetical protein Q9184_005921 [Pyrenodesmia sp. 2 TL-2023]